jgi:CIC family chloride channel protein
VSRLLREDSVYASSLRRQHDIRPKRPLSDFRIGELVKPDRPSLAPDVTLAVLAEAFAAHRVQYLYVTDGAKRFLGAVSLHEVARRIGQGTAGTAVTARDLLIPDFARLRPDMSIGEALTIFARHHGERLPVVAAEVQGGTLLGSVSKTDLLFLMQDSADSP